MAKDAYTQAVTMARYWWCLYRRMPFWRPLAKRKALRYAQYWGARAIKLKSTE